MINKYRAKKFCRDDISKIENYDKAIADTTQTWDLHHRLELTLDGEFAHSRDELKRLGMYYNRPYFELIFLSRSEHTSLHSRGKNNPFCGMKGTSFTAEHRQKLSNAHKGRKRRPFTAEHRHKMSAAHKGKRLKLVDGRRVCY